MSAFISNVLLQLICQPNASVKFLTNPKLDFIIMYYKANMRIFITKSCKEISKIYFKLKINI